MDGSGPIDPRANPRVWAGDLGRLPVVRYLDTVPGKVVPEVGTACLYGPPGQGKTLLAMHWMLTTALARRVEYVLLEGHGAAYPRVEAWRRHHGRAIGELYFWFRPLDLLSEEATFTWIAAARDADAERPVGVVVIDTLSKSIAGADENNQAEMSLMARNVGLIRDELNCLVLLIHHANRADSGYRGSSVLEGDVDVLARVVNHDGILELTCEKMRAGRPFDPQHYRIVEVPLADENGDPLPGACIERVSAEAAEVLRVEGEISPQQRRVLEALLLDGNGLTRANILSVARMSDSTLYYVLSALKGRGYIDQDRKGGAYLILPAGRAALKAAQIDSSPVVSSGFPVGRLETVSSGFQSVSSPVSSTSPVALEGGDARARPAGARGVNTSLTGTISNPPRGIGDSSQARVYEKETETQAARVPASNGVSPVSSGFQSVSSASPALSAGHPSPVGFQSVSSPATGDVRRELAAVEACRRLIGKGQFKSARVALDQVTDARRRADLEHELTVCERKGQPA